MQRHHPVRPRPEGAEKGGASGAPLPVPPLSPSFPFACAVRAPSPLFAASFRRLSASPVFPVPLVAGRVGADRVLLPAATVLRCRVLGLEGRGEALVVQALPVEAEEERVHLHVVRIVLNCEF